MDLEFVTSEADRTLDAAAVAACVALVGSGRVQVVSPPERLAG